MSIKEDALAKFAPGALGMVAEFTANIQPENEVAQFIDENIGILSKTKEDDEADVAHGLLQKLSVAEANKDPQFSLDKLLEFYEQFRIFYVDYTSTPEAPTRLPEDEGGVPHYMAFEDEDKGEGEDTTENIEPTKDDATDPE